MTLSGAAKNTFSLFFLLCFLNLFAEVYDDNVVPQQDEYLAPTEQELKQAKTNAKVGSTSTSQTEVRHCDLTT